jgi:uncharacterized protein
MGFVMLVSMKKTASSVYGITNLRTQKSLGCAIAVADTYWLRLCGLLGKTHLNEGEGLLIQPCSDIHSIGMRFRFDAIFLNASWGVVHIEHAMKPWRVSRYVRQAKSILELPAGVALATDTQLGDSLLLEPRLR